MISVNGKSYKVGLALSGGGFRASIFHMGVLRRLWELGILPKIDLISTVSGGSIVGAFYVFNLARGQSFLETEAAFTKALKANIRLRALTASAAFHPFRAARALLPGYTRTNVTAAEYDRLLFQGATLQDLPDDQKLIINATSLNTGLVWKFSKDAMGDYRYGYAADPQVPLSDAVGASAAVPGLFPPLVLHRKYYDGNGFSGGQSPPSFERIALSDGGVRDNQGLTSILSEKCRYVICSDASGLIDIEPNPSTSAVKVLLRSNTVTMDAARDLIVTKVFEHKELEQIRQIVFFDMEDEATGGAPGLPAELRHLAANTRTDLDWFSDEEIETISYHGYTLFDQKARKYGSDLLPGEWPPVPKTIFYSADKVNAIAAAMQKSSKRRIRPHRFS